MVNTCTLSEDRYVCESVCESVWFKVWNVTAAGPYGETCDPAFLGQYGNILFNCVDSITCRERATWEEIRSASCARRSVRRRRRLLC